MNGGDGGGGGTSAIRHPPSAIPPILPDGHLAQAREFLKSRAAIGASAEARVNQRWELVYLHEGKQWYRYEGTHYEAVPDSLLVGAVLDHCEPYYKIIAKGGREIVLPPKPDGSGGGIINVKRAAISTGNAKSIVEAMQADAGVFSPGGALPAWSSPTFDGSGRALWGSGLRKTTIEHKKVIPFSNGLLRIDALMDTSDPRHPGGRVVLEPHTPNFVSTSCAPFDFPVDLVQQQFDRDHDDEEAGGEWCARLCPTFRRVLAAAAGECENYAKEFMKYVGLCFTDDTSFEKILYQTGAQGTGKGTLFEGVTAAVGERNVYMSSAKALTDKFEMVNYVGKNIIGFDEFEAGHSTDAVEASRTLKTAGIGTATSVQGKFDDAYTTRITGKFWLISNKVARLRDSSAAMARRLLMFPMAIDTPKEGLQDPSIKRKVRAEARGIAIWALFHLRMLYREGKFIQPEAGKAAIADFKRLVSPVHALVTDCLVPGAENAMEESLLRELYVGYANWTGVGRLGMENLWTELKSALHGLSRGQDGERNRMIYGVRPRLADERGQKDTLYDDVPSRNRLADFGFKVGLGTEGVETRTEYPPGGGKGQSEIPY